MKISERDKLIALAHLHAGKTAKEIPDLVPDISYPQALRLRKELEKAKDADQLQALFDLEGAALESLLSSVKDELSEAAEALTGDYLPLEDAIGKVASNVEGMQLLERELSDSARTVVKQIKIAAGATTSTESLLILSEALSKLQTAYFKSSNVQIANLGGGGGFEKFLSD